MQNKDDGKVEKAWAAVKAMPTPEQKEEWIAKWIERAQKLQPELTDTERLRSHYLENFRVYWEWEQFQKCL